MLISIQIKEIKVSLDYKVTKVIQYVFIRVSAQQRNTINTNQHSTLFQGPIGVTGPIGPTGDIGPKGDQGDKGEKGEKGVKGQKVSIPNLVMIYFITIIYLACISQGEKGIEGQKGVHGETGQKGDTGEVSKIFDYHLALYYSLLLRLVKLVKKVKKVRSTVELILLIYYSNHKIMLFQEPKVIKEYKDLLDHKVLKENK